jgi:exocyst complex component 8
MDWMSELAKSAGETPGSDAKEKAERDAQFAAEWADDLTVAISLKEWEKATKLVEEGGFQISGDTPTDSLTILLGKGKSAINPPLAVKLPPLTTQLINSLLESLSRPSNQKTSSVFLISLLLRLGAAPAARVTFLEMRTEVIKNYVKKIPFGGHVGAYIGDLAIVYFTGIKHTADWFLAGFKENEVSSGGYHKTLAQHRC